MRPHNHHANPNAAHAIKKVAMISTGCITNSPSAAIQFGVSISQAWRLTLSATIESDHCLPLTLRTISELCSLYVPNHGGSIMVRAVVEEAGALASIALFMAMVAVWAQVLGVI